MACASSVRRLKAWVEALAELDTSAYAWVFPRSARTFADSESYICPGVAVLIREVKR